MNERVFNRGIEHLRDPERLERLEISRVVDLSIKGMQPETTSVLDVGCGTALFAEAFAKSGCRIAGIDINQAMITEAKRLVPSGDFRLGSAEKMPFKDRSFDIVFFGLVLHETDDLKQSLKEAHRIARKRVIAVEWPYEKSDKGPPLEHRLTPERITDGANKAGLSSVTSTRLKYLVFYEMKIAIAKT